MNKFIITLTILFGINIGFANANIQNSCRAQAKQAAQNTYASCIQTAKKSELEKIQKDYKSKMAQLKNYYEKKIKSLSGKPSSTNQGQMESSPTSDSSTELPTKRIEVRGDVIESEVESQVETRSELESELESSQSL